MIRVLRVLWRWLTTIRRDKSYDTIKRWEEIEHVGQPKRPPRYYSRWY